MDADDADANLGCDTCREIWRENETTIEGGYRLQLNIDRGRERCY